MWYREKKLRQRLFDWFCGSPWAFSATIEYRTSGSLIFTLLSHTKLSWKLFWKLKDCEIKEQTNFFIDLFGKISTHYRRPTISGFVMDVCSSVFEKAYLMTHYTFTPNVCPVYGTQFRINICCWQFFGPKKSYHSLHLTFRGIFYGGTPGVTPECPRRGGQLNSFILYITHTLDKYNMLLFTKPLLLNIYIWCLILVSLVFIW